MRFLLAILAFSAQIFLACKPNAGGNSAQNSALRPEIDTATGAPKRIENRWKDNANTLLPDDVFERIFGVNPAKDANVRTLAGTGLCLWQWHKPDWKERGAAVDRGASNLSSENSLSLKIISYGAETDARALFLSQRPPNAVDVPGIGDGAFWVNNDRLLIARKGAFCLNVILEYTDEAKDNLPKAMEVAAAALHRIEN